MNQFQCRLGDYTVSYSDVGQGKPLVMLHGFLANAAVWTSLISRLSHQYRCISIDLLGFGDSSKPDIPFSIGDQVAIVRQLIQALDLEEYALIGHSLGGWIATAYALKYQDASISRLILLAAAGIPSQEFDVRMFLYLPLMIPHPWMDMAMLLSMPILNLWGREAEVRHFSKARQYFRQRPQASEQALKSFFEPNQASEMIAHRLHELNVPTLVITGTKDQVIPLSHAQTYAEKILQSELHILEHAKHDLHLTHAAEIAAKILAD